MRFYLCLLVFYCSFVSAWPSAGIIYNHPTDKKIALGVFPQGHLNVVDANIATNATATGLATNVFSDGKWRDATSPGCLCEGWSAGATSMIDGRQYHGEASVDNIRHINNITVKNFVVDTTSIESLVVIKGFRERRKSFGNDMLEVKHVYSPSKLATDELFEVNVTLTNVSGNTLKTVRYNRTMDWDIYPSEFNEVVTIVGAEESARSATKPRIYASGNNGFRNPNVFGPKSTGWSGYSYWPHTGVNRNGHRMGPRDHGFSATFEFDDLVCGESHTFKTYYGAARTRELMIAAFVKEGVPIYSIGESSSRTGVVYGFGFKGVSGTALAPSLPEKTSILPGGIRTDPDVVQTYAPPLIATIKRRDSRDKSFYGTDSDKYAYQAVFNYRQDHQWEGDILRYTLDSNGDFTPGEIPVSAATILKARINESNYQRSYEEGGRNIWTVSQTDICSGLGKTIDPSFTYGNRKLITYVHAPGNAVFDLNNFTTSVASRFEPFFYNCQTGDDEEDIIKFVRGYDVWNEDGPSGTKGPGNMRKSLLGDTFHSNLVYVGPPNDSMVSDNEKSEAYFRKIKRYDYFKTMYRNREGRIYVGANDGMLHSFDKDLNLRWSFIPPPILSKLRGLKGADPSGTTNGTSNTKFLVDGPIIVKDIYSPQEYKWKTILVGSLGYGGKGYYMLDISDPRGPIFMAAVENDDRNNRVLTWNRGGEMKVHKYGGGSSSGYIGMINKPWPYQYLGYTLSKPSIVLLPISNGRHPRSQQRHALVFGAGYAGGMSTNQGNYVILADVDKRLSNAGTAAPDGNRYPSFNAFDTLGWAKIPTDSASDANKGVTAAMSVVIPDTTDSTDHYGGIAYFPDLHGQLWKLDLSRKTLPPYLTTYQHYQDLKRHDSGTSTVVTATEDSANGDSSMFQLNKLWRSETTIANDRFGSHQVGTTLVEAIGGKNVYNFFGTGNQARVNTQYRTIDNWIVGVRDDDFPETGLALTGTDKTKSSAGIHYRNISSSGTGTTCSSTDQPGWYAKLNDRFNPGTARLPRVTGRILISNSDLYVPVYQPTNMTCPVDGDATILIMKNGCGGTLSEFDIGKGLSTSVVSDDDGNLYVGISNETVASSLEATKKADNIVKIGVSTESTTSASTVTPGIRIKSWRELFSN